MQHITFKYTFKRNTGLIFGVLNCFIGLTFFFALPLNAQNIDSLEFLLKNAKHDTTRCNLLSRLIDAEMDENKWPKYNLELTKIAERNIGSKTKLATAMDTFFNVHLANSYSNSGLHAHGLGDFKTAVLFYNKALGREKLSNNKENLALIYNNLGGVYSEQKLDESAIEYFLKSMKIREEIKDMDGIEQSYSNVASAYESVHDTANARIYYFKAVDMFKKTNNLKRGALAYNNLGTFFRKIGDFKKAEEYFNNSLELQTKLKNKRGICVVMGNIAELLRLQKKYKEAKVYAEKAMVLAKEIGFPTHIKSQALTLFALDTTLGDWHNAHWHYKLFLKMKDSLNSVDNAKAAMKLQMQTDYEKQKAVDQAVHEKELVLSEEREQKQKVVSIAVGLGLFLAIVFAVFIFNRLRVTNRQKKIIEEQKHLVEEKNTIIEEKQKEIIDSINYAKRIQHTLLAHEEVLDVYLPDHFVLFKPKDIVSGDFYWATTVNIESGIKNDEFTHRQSELVSGSKQGAKNKELFYLAVCDSTGHGVPGAFMSLLNISFLNEAINEKKILEPNQVLNHVRKRLVEELSKDGAQDGMDAILICIESEVNGQTKTISKITYAAANNSPVLLSNSKITELGKDKMPVGKGEREDSFTLRNIDVKTGDVIYLYTDGFADQFGGPKGKKFKYKALNELILNNHLSDLNKQKHLLEETFNQWKGNLEQVDDVCIIGIRV